MNRIFYAMVAIAFLATVMAQLTWAPAMNHPDVQAVALADGSLLAVGGGRADRLVAESWSDTLDPGVAGTLVAAGDGALLVPAADESADVWVFDGLMWSAGVPLPQPLAQPSVVALPNGDVLLVGGTVAGAAYAGHWIYESERPGWRRLGSGLPRVGATLTPLGDGTVLIVGGRDASGAVIEAVQTLDPRTGELIERAPLLGGRVGHAAVAVDGGVMVLGGESRGPGMVPSALALDLRIYRPESNAWRRVGQLPRGVRDARAAAVDGGVLLASGRTSDGKPMTQALLWRDGSTLSVPLQHPSADAALARGAAGVHLFGGQSGWFAAGKVLKYNAERNGWEPRTPASPMQNLTNRLLKKAETAVLKLVFPLIGAMTFFLGLMKVAEDGGLMVVLARLIRPLMVRLFPDVPPDHPAMGAMIMNMAANALGLGNAATPFGIRAMERLNELNPHKGTASNSMALFLAINTSSVTLLPTGVIAIRAALGSSDPAGIMVTTLFATVFSTTAAIIAAKTYQRFSPLPDLPVQAEEPPELFESEAPSEPSEPSDLPPVEDGAYPAWVSYSAIGLLFSLVPLSILFQDAVASLAVWVVPVLIIVMFSFGYARGVPVYESFVNGAREGVAIAMRIIPYVVGILVVVEMFRASGAMNAMIFGGHIGSLYVPGLNAATSLVGLPGEALPMALLRPLSGSGALGIMMETMTQPGTGPDTYVGYLVSTFQGTTETTFYVLAVYFGAVQVQRIRHSMAAALTADAVGIVSAVFICWLLYGNL